MQRYHLVYQLSYYNYQRVRVRLTKAMAGLRCQTALLLLAGAVLLFSKPGEHKWWWQSGPLSVSRLAFQWSRASMCCYDSSLMPYRTSSRHANYFVPFAGSSWHKDRLLARKLAGAGACQLQCFLPEFPKCWPTTTTTPNSSLNLRVWRRATQTSAGSTPWATQQRTGNLWSYKYQKGWQR